MAESRLTEASWSTIGVCKKSEYSLAAPPPAIGAKDKHSPQD
jgi:hypothetical protein